MQLSRWNPLVFRRTAGRAKLSGSSANSEPASVAGPAADFIGSMKLTEGSCFIHSTYTTRAGLSFIETSGVFHN
jgi:hypothetical protein